MNSTFTYTTEIIDELKKSISEERIDTYVSKVGGDITEALRLYVWNTHISSAFYVPLQALEVTLRNALHVQLSCKFNRDSWYEVAPLSDMGKREIEKAEQKVEGLHRKVTVPHVVAELSFGFWQSLLSKRYHGTLWIPSLHKSFPNVRMKCTEIHTALGHLRILRNRIAHHEPIFGRHLANDYSSIIRTLGWMSSDTANWVDCHNNVREVLGHRVHSIDIERPARGEA